MAQLPSLSSMANASIPRPEGYNSQPGLVPVDLADVFDQVSRHFTAVPDAEDRWLDPTHHQLGQPAAGDCEDFAVLCWWHSKERGYPARIVLCTVPEQWPADGHAVCEAQGWILDVRQVKVVPRQALPYRWQFISDTDLKHWYPITG